MKKHQIALSVLFLALPFFVIAFLTNDVGQPEDSPSEAPDPALITSCEGKDRGVFHKNKPNHKLPLNGDTQFLSDEHLTKPLADEL